MGQRLHLVLTIICFDSLGMMHLAQSSDRRGVRLWVKGELPREATVAGVDLLVTSLDPVQLDLDSQSFVVPVPPAARPDLYCVVDLCSGLGGLSYAAQQAGFKVKIGVDQNGLWRKLYEGMHEGVAFCTGDLVDPSVLRQLLTMGLFHGVVCAGIACQPHSILGDRKGMSDPRAQSLPKTLLVAWLLQAAVLILECTPEILRDPQAQEILRQYTVATGFRMVQTVMKLSNSWCGKRDRWIAVLTAPVLPVCQLPDMPKCDQVQFVRDLIPEFGVWPQFEQAQLTLNLYELAKYYQFAAGGIDAAWVKLAEKLPTLLHSAGNQLYTCACGCRAALSESRLRQRGLVGVLIPLPTCQTHMNIKMQHARYLHPLEMWALMGGKPDVGMGHNLRLAMAGVGQAVAPLMGVWIFAHVRKCLDDTLNVSPSDPEAIFHEYMGSLIQTCKDKWPPLPPPTAEDPMTEDPIEDIADHAGPALVTLTKPGTGEPDVQIRVSPGTTGHQLIQAEHALTNQSLDFQIRLDGEPVDLALPLPHMSLVSMVSPQWDPASLKADQCIPCCLGVAEFLQYIRASDASEAGPVTDVSRLSVVRHPHMSRMARAGLLCLQAAVWGDDEILFGLERVASDASADQYAVVWDPLLLSGLVQHDTPATWQHLLKSVGSVATIVSAVLLGGHWIPLVWRVDPLGSVLHTLSVTPDYVPVLERLCRVVELVRGGSKGVWRAHNIGFVPEGYCGALTVAFVRHLLWGWPMIKDQHDLQLASQSMRMEFENFLGDPCITPVLAGLGVSLASRLAELLVQHGVPSHDSGARANAALKVLGEAGLAKALDSDNPWRELKWLGNQLRPPFMFIKPSELQAQIERRAAEKPIGHKKHKQAKTPKGKGKGSAEKPQSVDPTTLRLEHGLFQSEAGQPLHQIGFSQVGSAVAGIVVASVSAAEPYLQATNPISSGPLAFFIVDALESPPTQFPTSQLRIPLVCAVNAEPLLLDGYLIQVGAIGVERTPMQPGSTVQTVPTCVVKVLVFRDQSTVQWPAIVAHPMLHVFDKVPPLQKCTDQECCGCESWHKTLDFPMDTPVLELWGKQWLRMDFRHTSPDQAEMFTAHMRLPEHLQTQVQYFSGHDGVYLEPKSLDGRQPSQDFQVIWMPKADQAQLMVQRQTVAHVVGLARLGHKMGLRCKTEHAAEVFATLRPGLTFLPPGKRQTYLVGPFSFGTLQSSVAQVLQTNGWTAKPIQAVAAKSHIQGLMFKVQSVQEPPCKVMRMAHGDVMIAKDEDSLSQDRSEPRVLATAATASMVSKPVDMDYIQLNDPWAKAASKLPPKQAKFQIGNPLEDMAQKVLTEVMSQIPKAAMEVDADGSTDTRVAALEQQVQDLKGQTQALVVASQQTAADTANQLQDLRGQIHQQGTHFESAIAAQATSMQGFQESVQEQFRQQVCHQQTMLDNMFSKQMAQFETLLAKRPRQE